MSKENENPKVNIKGGIRRVTLSLGASALAYYITAPFIEQLDQYFVKPTTDPAANEFFTYFFDSRNEENVMQLLQYGVKYSQRKLQPNELGKWGENFVQLRADEQPDQQLDVLTAAIYATRFFPPIYWKTRNERNQYIELFSVTDSKPNQNSSFLFQSGEKGSEILAIVLPKPQNSTLFRIAINSTTDISDSSSTHEKTLIILYGMVYGLLIRRPNSNSVIELFAKDDKSFNPFIPAVEAVWSYILGIGEFDNKKENAIANFLDSATYIDGITTYRDLHAKMVNNTNKIAIASEFFGWENQPQ